MLDNKLPAPGSSKSHTASLIAPTLGLPVKSGCQHASQGGQRCGRCCAYLGADQNSALPYAAAIFASMLSQIIAARSTPSNRMTSCKPVGEVTLISVR